jgi:GrpB-like predicted nucleotidyltransferase (UPF0157 family)
VPAVTAKGYRLRAREPDWEQHRLMKGEQPSVDLRILTIGLREIERVLAFRDRLRGVPEEREL